MIRLNAFDRLYRNTDKCSLRYRPETDAQSLILETGVRTAKTGRKITFVHTLSTDIDSLTFLHAVVFSRLFSNIKKYLRPEQNIRKTLLVYTISRFDLKHLRNVTNSFHKTRARSEY